jgi:diadenosine tetraphosphate (Ap4A) HIT family hydrolase
VAKVAQDLGLEAEGYRITANHGPHGGQLVLHFHVHIIGGRQMSHRMGNASRGGAQE